MSNKNLFKSSRSGSLAVKATNTVNAAGGTAYSLEDKAALAQLACTGTFNSTFYIDEKKQLEEVLKLASKCDAKFLAKLAVYAREAGLMKDTPALLAAVLAGKDAVLLKKVFSRVVNDPKMVRNYVQMMRSGVTGRKSLGSVSKKLVQGYLESLTDEQLFRANVGQSPSLKDIISLTHPKAGDKKRNALYAYLLGKEHNKSDLSYLVRAFEDFKKDMVGEIPSVPFQMLTSLPLTDKHWKQIAENATWNQTRMNLNTMLRHNVFNDSKMVDLVAKKLANSELIAKAKVFPYQLFSAFKHVESTMPVKITNALQKAAELSISNIPEFDGKIYVLVDTSGSMNSPITGNRGSVTSKITCIEVASLIASSILRKNPEAEIIPFDTRVHVNTKLNPMDSVMTNTSILSKFGGGGTDCASAVKYLNDRKVKGDLVIMLSDNESWAMSSDSSYYSGTGAANEWAVFKNRNPKAKMVCLDLTPNTTTQLQSKKDVLNLGGFSDQMFSVISQFAEKGNDDQFWVNLIESVEI